MARTRRIAVVLTALAACAGCAGSDGAASSARLVGDAAAAVPAAASGSTPVSTSAVSTTRPATTPSTLPLPSSVTTSTIISTTTTPPTTTSTSSTTTTIPATPMTRCREVVHIADSTGVYLWEPEYVGGEQASTMGDRYRAVGVESFWSDVSGGRSMTERIADWQTNAVEVAHTVRAGGYDGCWVIMMGTNDAANVAAGSGVSLAERIMTLLYVIGDQPVLWLDTVTERTTGSYSNTVMTAFNAELDRIAADRPNVQVVRWSAMVVPEWFRDDGIHYTPEGRAWRAVVTAAALAERFPSID